MSIGGLTRLAAISAPAAGSTGSSKVRDEVPASTGRCSGRLIPGPRLRPRRPL